MKIWVDDVRPAPEGYVWCKSVLHAQELIQESDDFMLYPLTDVYNIDLIDLDHDAGDYRIYGEDYIKLLDWLEETGRSYPIHIHSMNPVGGANMMRIIEKNGWEYVD